VTDSRRPSEAQSTEAVGDPATTVDTAAEAPTGGTPETAGPAGGAEFLDSSTTGGRADGSAKVHGDPLADAVPGGKHDSGGHDNGGHDSGRHDSGRHDSGRHDMGRHDSDRHDTGRHGGGKHDADRLDGNRQEPGRHEVDEESSEHAEISALRTSLEERTRDLQRVTAEYANYRKRVDRDRALVVEQATGNVIAVLLPVLDDLDRARDHGDLTGPFAAVADQLTAALAKFGLTPFGATGDAFDPTRHEAVAHRTSADVTEPSCVAIMRRGYQLGERLLRPALVEVADPE
jgi:molecular chaperone GrpE (heat shock protein)